MEDLGDRRTFLQQREYVLIQAGQSVVSANLECSFYRGLSVQGGTQCEDSAGSIAAPAVDQNRSLLYCKQGVELCSSTPVKGLPVGNRNSEILKSESLDHGSLVHSSVLVLSSQIDHADQTFACEMAELFRCGLAADNETVPRLSLVWNLGLHGFRNCCI
jgi:hypothetical protein